MYTSMCIKDIADYKKGDIFDTYQKRGSNYYFMRPEMTDEEFHKIHEADYRSSFIQVYDSISLRGAYMNKPFQILGHHIYPNGKTAGFYDYYKFDFLNRKLLRLLQVSVTTQLLNLHHYVIHKEQYEAIKGIIESLETKLKRPEITEEIAKEVILDFALFLANILEPIKAGPMKDE